MISNNMEIKDSGGGTYNLKETGIVINHAPCQLFEIVG